ncbi:MAG: permease-like cell division protein FtsX [Burkholderiales bacterium]|nr:permease-like cell division protein FtsX [Burkholderiales bacterium]
MKLFTMHYRGCISAFIRIFNKPLANLLNIIVIAIILSMLSIVFILGKSTQTWEKNNVNYPQIMIFLNQDAKQNDVSVIEAALNKFNKRLIKDYQFIGKEQGLKELSQDTQTKKIASDLIDESANPLPDILIINTTTTDTKLLTQLTSKIEKMSNVDDVQMDSNYAQKVNDLLVFVKHITGLLQIVFIVVFVIIIYNMIRLEMMLCQTEITVSRLIGASDSFIMRPLAYYAILQVVLGSVVSYLMVNQFINYLNNLFLQLNNLFGNDFLLSKMSYQQCGQMLASLIVFTILAVFLAVRWVFKNSYSQ